MNFIESFIKKESPITYSKYFYTSSYLKHMYSKVLLDLNGEEGIAAALGYNFNNPQKRFQFRKTVQKMNNLDADIPLLYLELIKADKEIIKMCLEEDLLAYKRELTNPRFPKFSSFRYMACVYGSLTFPDGTTENQAIDLCIEHLNIKPFTHIINYQNFLWIFISKDGVSRVYFEPQIRFTSKTMVVKYKNRDRSICQTLI
ncbi:MAG: hypothetical protein JXR64_06990 [Spirochaetales bacterium]|nr:hypothetical protein [Spirochaetales bacterium]